MKKNYKAYIFDLNGTLIDDMSYHVQAWHGLLTGFGANISLEETKAQCYGKNQELLERVFPGRFSAEEKDRISLKKEEGYQSAYRPHMALMPGMKELLEAAHRRGIRMGIGSAAIGFNVDFVLDGLGIRHYFDAIVSADHVLTSKPDPETFEKCAQILQADPSDCLIFEDAPKGVEAAANAGMDCLVITTMHEREEFELYKNIIGFVKDYHDEHLGELI